MHKTFETVFTRYPRKSVRFLEIFLPVISLSLIALPFWAAAVFPVQLAYFIIFFDIYWLYKSLNLSICSFIAARKIKEAEKVNWLQKAEMSPDFKKVHHIIVIPTYKESVTILKECINTLRDQTFPLKRLLVFVAMEEREEGAKEKAELLRKEYEKVFGGIFFTYHPDVLGEVKGKSSNQAYAAIQAYEILIQQKKLDINYITITSADADAVFDPQYYSYLAYAFLSSLKPHLAIWQSANVNYNNFWKVPAFIRVIAFFGSLWRASLLVQGPRLIPNSIYSLSFKLLHELGYWDTDVIPEDYRIFFKAFFMKQGKVTVEPIFLKTSMDCAQSYTYFKSLKNKYYQEMRWSWGISDDVVYIKWWLTVKNVPFFKKTYLLGNVLLEHILWPVNWFLITVSANIVAFINPVFSRSNLGYTLPTLSGFILTLCLFSLFIMIYVDFDLRSKKYSETSKLRQFMFPLEFVLMPIAGFFLSTLPALVSHIQLLFGKRMEYKVTEKV